MESTDQEAIRRYYGSDREEEVSEEDCNDGTILDVKNIADTVLFISFYLIMGWYFILRFEAAATCWSQCYFNRTLAMPTVVCLLDTNVYSLWVISFG